MKQRLANDPAEMKLEYETVIIGSGYGGSITAARLADKGHQVCVLERGKEWFVGDFPDTFIEMAKSMRRKNNPLGLVDYYLCKDIDVLKGSGLGGGSLINLNVAFRPDQEYFAGSEWPTAIQDLAGSGRLWDYYERAEGILLPNPHPRWSQLTKVRMMKRRVDQISDAKFGPANLTVNFAHEGPNRFGVTQKPCIDCGDCFPGCNVGAKNTMTMNYLPWAKKGGAEIYTQLDVRYLEENSSGGWTVYYRRCTGDEKGEIQSLRAKRIVLSAGSVGSTEILLRSKAHGLVVSGELGKGFSGNGDYLSCSYNNDERTNVLGFGNHLDSKRAQVRPGPTIVSAIQYDRSKPFDQRITIEDFSLLPSGLVDTFRRALPLLAVTGTDTDGSFVDEFREGTRTAKDLAMWSANGALNHSMVYLAMAVDDAGGTIGLDKDDKVEIKWPTLREDPIWDHIKRELLAHAKVLGGTSLQLDRFNPWASDNANLVTAHPLGGSCMADHPDGGAVDADGRVFNGNGGTHDGLYVADGAILPRSIGVNPFLSISAFSERIAERMVETMDAA